MDYVGTSGNDVFAGTNHDDTFDLTLGGDDTATGKNGFDLFNLGDAFTKRDVIDGGGGASDFVLLNGDYSSGVSISSHTMKNIEFLSLGGGFDYLFTFTDSVVAAGANMVIDGGSLGPGDFLGVHAEAETSANYTVLSGGGGDLLATGGGNDLLSAGDDADLLAPGMGNDTALAGGGDDFIELDGTGAFNAGDAIDGGDGIDGLYLMGDYSAGLTITQAMMTGVEKMQLYPGTSYKFALADGSLPAAGYFLLDGTALTAGDVLTVNGSALANYGRLVAYGGHGDDVLTGGANTDTLFGNEGADTLKGGSDADEYGYAEAPESTGPTFDTIVGFDALHDRIRTDLPASVHAPVEVGKLGSAQFNADLEAAIGNHEMHAGSAVLFTPSNGTFDGELFLIVDKGGGGGYQADLDLVIHFESAKHMADFSLADFGFVA